MERVRNFNETCHRNKMPVLGHVKKPKTFFFPHKGEFESLPVNFKTHAAVLVFVSRTYV